MSVIKSKAAKEMIRETSEAERENLCSRRRRMMLYHRAEVHPAGRIYRGMRVLAEVCKKGHEITDDMKELALRCASDLLFVGVGSGFEGNLWHAYLADLLLNDLNEYTFYAERRTEPPKGTLNKLALADFELFLEAFSIDISMIAEHTETPQLALLTEYKPPFKDAGAGVRYSKAISKAICEIGKKLAGCEKSEEIRDALWRFYCIYGVGDIALHKAFRVEEKEGMPVSGIPIPPRPNPMDNATLGGPDLKDYHYSRVNIIPVTNNDQARLSDLVGIEGAKDKLRKNTESFLLGRKANNCLLFGDAGTGKSTAVKAIANEYYDRGLRVIELYRHQFKCLPDLIEQLRYRNYKFILFMDDLSFEDYETEYKYLKALIEGGIAEVPSNVVIYATSNRRHLIRENYSDKEDQEDMHTGDTVQEKLSLAYRFGVTIYFGKPNKKEFQEIVRQLAARGNIKMDEEELLLEANKWELSHGGLSGRTAQQFIDYLDGLRK